MYVDFHTGSLFLEKDEELSRYRLAFEYLQAQALGMEASSAMIHRARSSLLHRRGSTAGHATGLRIRGQVRRAEPRR
ncbi:Scr1 family TA system antitoxin-like transcriptional regulator [Streptomyces sp. NPDC059378]|uniref:Scr1 family TA system antitoxin-like transcriptional regulator n=1 Tax=Streptomyces sp. NPDC059378 TaxID=3346815 RepID=UPI0036A4C021